MSPIRLAVCLALASAAIWPLRAADDILVADFEGPGYGDWKSTGAAFGSGPARGALPGQMAVDGFLGRGLVNSYFEGDAATGTLTSPEFTLQRRYLKFLIGGGGFEGLTCMNLLVDGKVVRTATGPNTKANGSEHLDWQAWEVGEFAGRRAVLQIVDNATGGWGHINVDHILQSDQRLLGYLTNAVRTMVMEKRYLNLPVKNGAPLRRVSVAAAGQPIREFDIPLADGLPDWWAFLDVAAAKGRPAAITVGRIREDSTGLSSIDQSDEIKGAENLYHEALRPQFHFSSRRGWNNDPNGLVFYQGEYHMFYQHNPYGWDWGNMHWGHAVSPDLIHWKELGEALYPDEHGTMFSGSAVVDWGNTAGFQTGPEKALVCIFTAAGAPFTQGLAYSNDRGRTWTKYQHNPVLGHVQGENRDPKVFWYKPQGKWVMALYLDGSTYALFSSPDLKQWEKLSEVRIPGTSECPEFFPLAVEGGAGEERWIFYGGNGRYLVGVFDGVRLNVESGPHTLHEGNAWYASQTFTDIPASDGRRILVPWGTMASPGMPFNQLMGIPVELKLRKTAAGLRLSAWPVREIESLRLPGAHALTAGDLHPGENPLSAVRGELLDLEAELAVGQAAELGFNLRGVPVSYDVAKQELHVADQKAAWRPAAGNLRLRFLVDRTTVEVFGDDGLLYFTAGVLVPAENRSIEVYAKGGTARIASLAVHELKSAWQP